MYIMATRTLEPAREFLWEGCKGSIVQKAASGSVNLNNGIKLPGDQFMVSGSAVKNSHSLVRASQRERRNR